MKSTTPTNIKMNKLWRNQSKIKASWRTLQRLSIKLHHKNSMMKLKTLMRKQRKKRMSATRHSHRSIGGWRVWLINVCKWRIKHVKIVKKAGAATVTRMIWSWLKLWVHSESSFSFQISHHQLTQTLFVRTTKTRPAGKSTQFKLREAAYLRKRLRQW